MNSTELLNEIKNQLELLKYKGYDKNSFKSGYLLGYAKCLKLLQQTAISHWMPFDFNSIETRPAECGKYLICRKDGKIHWETWNGSGWAYNHKEVRYWAVICSP